MYRALDTEPISVIFVSFMYRVCIENFRRKCIVFCIVICIVHTFYQYRKRIENDVSSFCIVSISSMYLITIRCILYLLRYSILDVSSVYRNGIEKRYSIEVPTAARTYRACIERVSNKKCLDTVSRGVSRKSRYTYDTLRYNSIHLWGKCTPIHEGVNTRASKQA